MSRFQSGSLRREERKNGPIWLLRYYASRQSDGKRIERAVVIGTVRDFPSESAARGEVNRQDLLTQINAEPTKTTVRNPRVTFGELALGWQERELGEQGHLLKPRAHSTVASYKMYLKKYILPAWKDNVATRVEAWAVQDWLQSLKRDHRLANGTVSRLKQIMSLIYKHGRWYKKIPATCDPLKEIRCDSTSEYEPMTISPEQAFQIWAHLRHPESTLFLLVAATGLRMSEALGLKWSDIDPDKQQINVRRAWTLGKTGKPKSKSSKAPVPCAASLLAHLDAWRKETTYGRPDDWVFASTKTRGATPRSGGILVTDHLRKAAVAAGVLKVDSKQAWGMHCMRHSLASWLVGNGADIKVVQQMLRHSNPSITLQTNVHGRTEDRLAAQNRYLEATGVAGTARVLQ